MPRTDRKRTDTTWTSELVRGHGDQWGTCSESHQVELSRSLYCITVEGNLIERRQGRDLGNRLNRPRVIVRMHDRDEDRIGTQRRRDGRCLDVPGPGRVDDCYINTEFC
ncbi:hypothetical protein NJB14197_27100 [Mycobacterium montefiorense]|uniref:Uncharacterized protein n=1 Tax=Mycobacterium montefiorense TaxID=154654 RepID=A0AA37PN80_9MYCO|nr:hypothetical protein MmonteBS_22510 [Mycobacterium montefiorense]GKU35017.1 hypothetical protein NJB14191_23630 [Mycobacterium montefiorense]GKU41028.1 hypothetical protein NJB14192_30140 [Mycobacterium montefiorense]GKU47139.1 hypothetical protein NJB14194_37570 [Mycobacterium montefiorense]GKU49259.1 hypothetical protein NJB14195_05060 [Mycobacterium montefiorense]